MKIWFTPAVLIALAMASCAPSPVVRVDDDLPLDPPPPAKPKPTPHPGEGAMAQARKTYPELNKVGSIFNRTFRDLYAQEEAQNMATLQRPDWPLILAENTAEVLRPKNTPEPRVNPLDRGAYNGGTVIRPREAPATAR